MPAPILTDTLIDRVLSEQRQHLRPPSGRGHPAWPLRAVQALETLTTDGWSPIGWIERETRHATAGIGRYRARWQVDTGTVQREIDHG